MNSDHARIPLVNKFRRRARAPHAFRVTTRSSKSYRVTILWVLCKNGHFWGVQKGGEFLFSVDTHNAQVHLLIAFFLEYPPL